MKIYHPNLSSEPSKVVWKYIVSLVGAPQVVVLPVESKLLHAEFYESGFCAQEFALWFEVTTDAPRPGDHLQRVYQVFGTSDDEIPKMAKHVVTGVTWNEDHRNRRTTPQYVWHLFEYPNGTKVLD